MAFEIQIEVHMANNNDNNNNNSFVWLYLSWLHIEFCDFENRIMFSFIQHLEMSSG